jgi:Ca2+/H+ antiporter
MIPNHHDNEPLTLRASVTWLGIITLFVALLSEALVGAINGASEKYGVPMVGQCMLKPGFASTE